MGLKNLWRSLRRRKASEDEFNEGEYTDIHASLMKKYPEVSEYWYLGVLLCAAIFGFVCVAAYPTFTTAAVVPYGVLLAIIFVVPLGILRAVTGITVTLNVLAEFIGGMISHGNALSMNLFKSFGLVAPISYLEPRNHPTILTYTVGTSPVPMLWVSPAILSLHITSRSHPVTHSRHRWSPRSSRLLCLRLSCKFSLISRMSVVLMRLCVSLARETTRSSLLLSYGVQLDLLRFSVFTASILRSCLAGLLVSSHPSSCISWSRNIRVTSSSARFIPWPFGPARSGSRRIRSPICGPRFQSLGCLGSISEAATLLSGRR